MTLQLEILIRCFESMGLEPMVPDGGEPECGCYIGCASYRRPDGEDQALVVARPIFEGKVLLIGAFGAYSMKDCRYRAALHLALLLANKDLVHARFELDEAGDAVHLVAALPLMGSTLSQAQFECLVQDVHGALERYHPVLIEALHNGRVDMSQQWKAPAEPQPASVDHRPEHIHALRELIAALGGRGPFESLVRHLDGQEARK
jgi:hypothetical protein